MSSLKSSLNKLRIAGRELSRYFADVPVNSRATGKMLAGNVERYATAAIETHRKLQLIKEVEQLRVRDSGTQITPERIRSGYETQESTQTGHQINKDKLTTNNVNRQVKSQNVGKKGTTNIQDESSSEIVPNKKEQKKKQQPTKKLNL